MPWWLLVAGGGPRLFDDGLPATSWTVAYQETGATGELALVGMEPRPQRERQSLGAFMVDGAREREGLVPVRIRVGINSGPAVVGNVGTEKRDDYTVLYADDRGVSRIYAMTYADRLWVQHREDPGKRVDDRHVTPRGAGSSPGPAGVRGRGA